MPEPVPHRLWHSQVHVQADDRGDPELSGGTVEAVFWQGYAVGTLNPKTALFFLAFLPQFVAKGAGYVDPWLQMLVMGCVFVVMAILSDGLYALMSGTLAPCSAEARY